VNIADIDLRKVELIGLTIEAGDPRHYFIAGRFRLFFRLALEARGGQAQVEAAGRAQVFHGEGAVRL
jgi:hypothetical protein